MAIELKVTQKRSAIGRPGYQRRVLKGLGLNKIGRTVQVANEPAFRGMIKKVLHLVVVEEVQAN